jgi:hypothetical protein
MTRIHILLGEDEKARYRRQAEREGQSLGAWLRAAAEERLARADAARFSSVSQLDAFFHACGEREKGEEPDWNAHTAVIQRSRTRGLDVT